MLHGTDISAYQSTSVPAGDFVIIKATQGTGYVNSKLAAQLADARRKKMLVGFYHFPEFGNDPIRDADHFCNTVGPLLEPGDIVVLDHETDPPPSAAHASAWGRKWLTYTEARLKRRPWVYANLDWASGGYCAGMGAYPYWCADPSSPAGHPRVRGPFKTWVAHQYDVSGLDRDVFNGSASDWRALGQPRPQEDDEMIARDVKEGLDKKTKFPLKPGANTTVVAFADNSYTDGKLIKATAPVKLRIAVKHNDGSAYQVEEKMVGRVGTDATKEFVWFPISNAAHAVAVSVTRMDGDGTEPLTVGAY